MMASMKALGWILIAGALGCWVAYFEVPGSVPPLSLIYLPMSALTALVYRGDKARARAAGSGAGLRRVPERTLHLLELCGGWPGALWAREHFRHKTRDRAYRAWFWAIGFAHALGWVAYVRLS